MTAKIKLYGYAASSCTFRVRIALSYKEVDYEATSLDSEFQKSKEFAAINPQRLVPFLSVGKEGIAQSLAILEYAEESLPGPKLLPSDPKGRARVRGIASYVVSEIQPLQNTRLDTYLQALEVDVTEWKKHWVLEGLRHLEAILDSPETGKFCHGDAFSIADCCLVPQVYNAVNRFKLSIDQFPTVKRVYESACELEAVRKAKPDAQPDFGKR